MMLGLVCSVLNRGVRLFIADLRVRYPWIAYVVFTATADYPQSFLLADGALTALVSKH